MQLLLGEFCSSLQTMSTETATFESSCSNYNGIFQEIVYIRSHVQSQNIDLDDELSLSLPVTNLILINKVIDRNLNKSCSFFLGLQFSLIVLMFILNCASFVQLAIHDALENEQQCVEVNNGDGLPQQRRAQFP